MGFGKLAASKERERDCSKPRALYYGTAWLLFQYRNCNSYAMQSVPLLTGPNTPTHPKSLHLQLNPNYIHLCHAFRKKMEVVFN